MLITTKLDKYTIQKKIEAITNLINQTSIVKDGLLSGNLGKALFYFYLYQFSSNEEYKKVGQEIITGIFDTLSNHTSKLVREISLSNGLTGMAWSLNILSEEKLIKYDINEFLATIDQSLSNALPNHIEENNLDFLHSSIGALAYLADRTKMNPKLKDHLEVYAKSLQGKMEEYKGGGAFIKSQYFYKNFNFGNANDVNLSLSHGFCSIMLVLVSIYEKGIAQKTIQDIIEKGIAFILGIMKIDNFGKIKSSIFPSNIITSLPLDHEDNFRFYEQRMGWCYGDLNQLLLLYKAGNLLNRKDWIDIANHVGTFTLMKKDFESSQIKDCYLCHGSAGVAIFYKALYRVSGNDQYLDGYEYWMEKTILYLEEMFNDNTLPGNPCSFLEGLAGTGLALMSYLQEGNNKWEKFLLLQ